jgi:hypothetical protein
MRRLILDGHYGQQVEIDLCAPCHLVWFDSVESVRLTGTGMLGLLGVMADAQREPHRVLGRDARCARCAGTLKPVHNRSRWGPTLQLECRRQHGAYQTFAQFLSEKGLVRPLSSADRASLIQRGEGLHCLNCGAALGQDDQRCSYCDGTPGMLDIARLARALDPEGATETHAVHSTRAEHTALQCLMCGAALPKAQGLQCTQCGATLAVGQLSQAHQAVSVLERALREHAKSPAPHVVARRLQRLEADMPRRREWARQMEAEASSEPAEVGDGDLWEELRERPWRVAVMAVLLVCLLWWLHG